MRGNYADKIIAASIFNAAEANGVLVTADDAHSSQVAKTVLMNCDKLLEDIMRISQSSQSNSDNHDQSNITANEHSSCEEGIFDVAEKASGGISATEQHDKVINLIL